MKTTQRWMGAQRERERYRIRLRGHWRSRSPWLLRTASPPTNTNKTLSVHKVVLGTQFL
jgi:hypothetical protein